MTPLLQDKNAVVYGAGGAIGGAVGGERRSSGGLAGTVGVVAFDGHRGEEITSA